MLAVNVVEDVTEVSARRSPSASSPGEVARQVAGPRGDGRRSRGSRAAPRRLVRGEQPVDQGGLRTVAVAHKDPAKVRLAHEYNRRYATRVSDRRARRRSCATVRRSCQRHPGRDAPRGGRRPRAARDVRNTGCARRWSCRWSRRSGTIGTSSSSTPSPAPFTRRTSSSPRSSGAAPGPALENARLYTERTRIAHTLQVSLLPDALPDVPGFALAALYRPAGEESLVGGDFYDAFETERGWMIIIGDVTGRGAEAAALTARRATRCGRRGRCSATRSPRSSELNRALVARPTCRSARWPRSLLPRRVATARASSAPATRRRCSCAAGRSGPSAATGPMVGAWRDGRGGQPVALAPGDLLVLYTDGVIDACGRDGRFGEQRLAETVGDAADADGRGRSGSQARCRRSSAASRPTTRPCSVPAAARRALEAAGLASGGRSAPRAG